MTRRLYTSELLESGWSPKPLDGVRILTLVLIALDSPKVLALVHFQVEAVSKPS